MHAAVFTQRSFYTQDFLHRSFYTEKLLRTATLDTEKRSVYRELTHSKHLHRGALTHRSSYTEPFLVMIAPTIATPKSDLDAEAEKNTTAKAFE